MSDSEDDRFSNRLPAPPIALRERPAQRQKVGDRPEWLDEPKDTLTYQPVLGWLLQQEGGFFDTIASFARIYAKRCIAGVMYDVPQQGDGLYQFLRDLAVRMFGGLEGLQAEDKEHLLGKLRGDEDCKISLTLPQLFHGAEQHNGIMHDQNAVDVLGGRLCVFGGHQFQPVRVRADMSKFEDGFYLSEASMRAGSASIAFDWGGQKLQIVKNKDGKVKITLVAGYGQEQTLDAPPEMGALVEPETWLYRRVRDFRRLHAVHDRQKLDPLDLLMLQCAAELRDGGLVAGVLHFLSNGRFRSCAYKSKNGDRFELMICGGNCLWSADTGSAGWRGLCKLLQCQIGEMAKSPDLLPLVSALNEDGKLEQLKREIVSKDGALGGVENVTDDLLRAELQSRCTSIGSELDVLKSIGAAHTLFSSEFVFSTTGV